MKKIVYRASIDKCDRVEDCKVAWRWFEKILKDNDSKATPIKKLI